MRKNLSSTCGTIILETSIVLPIFILIVCFIYGFFRLTIAQNQVTHALFQASKSLSFDSYLTEQVVSASEANEFWMGLSDMMLDISRASNSEYYSSKDGWYTGAGDAGMAKRRWIGYFAGGDRVHAEEKLKALGIKGGLGGMQVGMTVEGEKMTITMEYEIQFWFDAFGLGGVPIKQSVTSRLWK